MPDKTILIVDDTPANITAALSILKDKYRTRVATSGARALEQAGASEKPDLILLDVLTPTASMAAAISSPVTWSGPAIWPTHGRLG